MCSKIGTIVKHQNGVVRAIKISCRSWSCNDCSKMRRKQLIAEAKEGKPSRFITLTCNPNWFNSPEERAQKMVEAWRTVRRRFLALSKNNVLEFLAVFELTARGEPHLHIVTRGSFIKQAWLSEQMRELMGAPIVDIRSVENSKKVAEYVSKYISKRNIKIGTLKRYWRSLKYLTVSRAELRRQRNKGATFYILNDHLWELCRELERRCIPLKEITDRSISFLWDDTWGPPPWCLLIDAIVVQ